ncbi:hypothetical protein, partial [Pontimicrobium sp. MEBiC01747]
MNKTTLLTIGLMFFVLFGFSQNRRQASKNIWTKTSQSRLEKEAKVHRSSKPSDFQLYELDLESLKRSIA